MHPAPTSELRPVVHRDGSGKASHLLQPLKHLLNPQAGQRGVNLDGQAFACVLVDHVQASKPPAIRQPFGDEVHQPALVRPCWHRQRLALDSSNAFASPLAHAQSRLAVLLAHKRTLREVLNAMMHYRHLLNDALGLYVETTGSEVIIREENLCEIGIWPRQTVELAVGVLARTCAAVLGPNWRPASVHFTHAAPGDLRIHSRIFGCPLVFESEFNGFVCLASDLDKPNPMADPELVRYAEGLAESASAVGRQTISAEVRNAIYLLLPVEQASTEDVARHLHLSVRSLQRHLEDAGTTFSNLLDEVRQELAVRYMSNERYSIGRVASLLGYTQQASFAQWFSRRFGMAPRTWRATQRPQPGTTPHASAT